MYKGAKIVRAKQTRVFDPRYLLTFKEIAETGSFSEASRRLSLTQGAVSHQIRQLEVSLKTKLFKREPGGVTLTAQGLALLKQSYKLQKFLEETYDLFGLRFESSTPLIKIFSGEIAALTFLPSVTIAFKKDYRVEFIVQTSNALSCLNALKEGKADIAFVGSIDFGEFKAIKHLYYVNKLIERELVAIVPLNHPLSNRESVTLGELLEYDFISRGYGSAVQRRLEDIIKNEHINPQKFRTRLILENSSSTITAVASGLGVSIVADIQAKKFQGLVRALKLETSNATIATYMVRPKHSSDPLIQKFATFTRRTLSEKH